MKLLPLIAFAILTHSSLAAFVEDEAYFVSTGVHRIYYQPNGKENYVAVRVTRFVGSTQYSHGTIVGTKDVIGKSPITYGVFRGTETLFLEAFRRALTWESATIQYTNEISQGDAIAFRVGVGLEGMDQEVKTERIVFEFTSVSNAEATRLISEHTGPNQDAAALALELSLKGIVHLNWHW